MGILTAQIYDILHKKYHLKQ